MNKKKCIILYSHGSKNNNWIKTFKKIKNLIKKYNININIKLAFLENIKPNITVTIKKNIKKGNKNIIIIPMFLSNGIHVKKNLPKLIEKIKKKFKINIKITSIFTKDKKILTAIAKFCIKQYNKY